MVVTASARFWKDCIALELKQRRYLRMGVRYLRMGVSVVFIIGFFCVSHLRIRVTCDFALSPFSSPTSFVSTASSSGESFAYNTWNPLLELLSNTLAASWYSLLMNLTWLTLLSLVSLLWIYYATRKVFTILNDSSSGTIA